MTSMEAFSLKGKNILITGASSGIGREIAKAVADAGANVAITGRNVERLAETRGAFPDNTDATVVAGDLTDREFTTQLSKDVPKLDGIVLNAGFVELYQLKQMTDEVIDRMIDINLVSQIRLFRDLYKAKKINRGASIVLMASITSAAVGAPANGLYGATKAGLTGFMKTMTLDLGKFNIRVNCVAPAMIETAGVMSLYDTVGQEALEKDKARYPLRRYGTTEEVAFPVVFLLSRAATYITGTTLTIDGGITAK